MNRLREAGRIAESQVRADWRAPAYSREVTQRTPVAGRRPEFTVVSDANALWNLWNRFRIGDVEIAFGYLFLVRVGLPRLETGEEVNDVPVAQEHGLGIDCVGLLGFGTTVFRRYLQLDIHLFAQTETNRSPLTSLIFL